MIGANPLLQINIRKQRTRALVRPPHRSPRSKPRRENHASAEGATNFFNNLLDACCMRNLQIFLISFIECHSASSRYLGASSAMISFDASTTGNSLLGPGGTWTFGSLTSYGTYGVLLNGRSTGGSGTRLVVGDDGQ